jgi:hypothetical protein
MNNHQWMWNELKEWVEQGEKEFKEKIEKAENTLSDGEMSRLCNRYIEFRTFHRKMDELEED